MFLIQKLKDITTNNNQIERGRVQSGRFDVKCPVYKSLIKYR